jgi:hypothetical protein
VNGGRENRTRIKTSDTTIFISWFGQVEYLTTPCYGVPMDEGCTQALSSDPTINLNTTVSLSRKYSVVRNLHTLQSLTPYTNDLE